MQTTLDTPSGGLKSFNTNTDVVYGKFQSGVEKITPGTDAVENDDDDVDDDEMLEPEDEAFDDDDLSDESYDDVDSDDQDLQLLRKTLDMSTGDQKPTEDKAKVPSIYLGYL